MVVFAAIPVEAPFLAGGLGYFGVAVSAAAVGATLTWGLRGCDSMTFRRHKSLFGSRWRGEFGIESQPLSLTMLGLTVLAVKNSWDVRTGNPKTTGTLDQNVLGTFLDMIGASGIFAGTTGRDIITGQDLGLSENARGALFGWSVVQFAATLLGARATWKWLRTLRP